MTIVTTARDQRRHPACSGRTIISSMQQQRESEPAFFPRGAVAFFIAMMAFYGVFWLLIMTIMVKRG